MVVGIRLVTCALSAWVLFALSAAASETTPLPDQDARVEQWVRQLGAPSFSAREAAARRLIDVGVAAKPALVRAIDDQDLEIRLSAHRVLVRILQNDFDVRVAEFLRSDDAGQQCDLPGWSRFRTLMGDARQTRELYAEMIRAESEVLNAFEHGGEELVEAVDKRIEHFTFRANGNQGREAAFGVANVATMLFIASQLPSLQESLADNTARQRLSLATSRLYSLLSPDAVRQIVLQQEFSPLVQRLMVHWMEVLGKESDGAHASNAMLLALKYDLGEPGVRIARQVLQSDTDYSSAKPYAAIVIGRFGGREDAHYLESHLKNTRVFHTWSNTQLKNEPIQIQVRDVMLAMLLRLHGNDPKGFGFELLDPFPETLYRIWSFGFLEDEQREAAFAKWSQDVALAR